MKELTIEQKAKRYDEALEIAKKNYITAQDLCNASQISLECFKNTLEHIFPEFKESEDERIRKELIEWMKDFPDMTWRCLSKEDIIAWLEKHDKKETLCSKCRRENPHDSCSYITAFGNCAIENEQKSTDESEQLDKYERLTDFERVLTDICSSWIGFELGWQSYIKDQARILKNMIDKQFHAVQNESSVCESTELKGKTASEGIEEIKVEDANEVEPKFKVGDWIASKMLNTALIVNIDDDKYEVEYIDGDKGFPHIEYVDRYYHLWSIRDAEDGDVLVSLSKMYPFIFNGHYDEDTDYVYAYCGISDIIKDASFYFDKYSNEEFKVWDSVENVRPATRDQCNLLFSKMKDSGYEWDAENKELKSHYKCIVTKDSRKGEVEIIT